MQLGSEADIFSLASAGAGDSDSRDRRLEDVVASQVQTKLQSITFSNSIDSCIEAASGALRTEARMVVLLEGITTTVTGFESLFQFATGVWETYEAGNGDRCFIQKDFTCVKSPDRPSPPPDLIYV